MSNLQEGYLKTEMKRHITGILRLSKKDISAIKSGKKVLRYNICSLADIHHKVVNGKSKILKVQTRARSTGTEVEIYNENLKTYSLDWETVHSE